jgi:hypothetical protein
MVEHAQIAERAEVVLTEPAELVLEVAVRAFERRIVLESERAVLLDAQELVASDHRPAVETVIVVADHAGVADRDEREQALGATQDAAELVDGVVGVAAARRTRAPTGGTSSSARGR